MHGIWFVLNVCVLLFCHHPCWLFGQPSTSRPCCSLKLGIYIMIRDAQGSTWFVLCRQVLIHTYPGSLPVRGQWPKVYLSMLATLTGSVANQSSSQPLWTIIGLVICNFISFYQWSEWTVTGYYDVDWWCVRNSLQSHMYPAYTQTFYILYLFYVNPAAFCWLNISRSFKGQQRLFSTWHHWCRQTFICHTDEFGCQALATWYMCQSQEPDWLGN